MSKSSPNFSALGPESTSFSRLSEEQRQRLADVLDRYLSALELGTPLDQDALLQDHPDLAPALRTHLRSLDGLHQMAAEIDRSPPNMERQRTGDGTGRIGDFEFIQEIGRGGMGVVYEARQISLNRRVAVKLLPFAA